MAALVGDYLIALHARRMVFDLLVPLSLYAQVGHGEKFSLELMTLKTAALFQQREEADKLQSAEYQAYRSHKICNAMCIVNQVELAHYQNPYQRRREHVDGKVGEGLQKQVNYVKPHPHDYGLTDGYDDY